MPQLRPLGWCCPTPPGSDREAMDRKRPRDTDHRYTVDTGTLPVGPLNTMEVGFSGSAQAVHTQLGCDEDYAV